MAAYFSPLAVSPDGASVLVWEQVSEQQYQLSVFSLSGEATATALIADTAVGRLSPDGRWIAYQPIGEAIYVSPFPNVEDGRWQISRERAQMPLWAPDGQELFYVSADGQLMSVSVVADPSFAPGNPEVIFDNVSTFGLLANTFDISPDGKRFLMIEEAPSDETKRPRLIIVQNWTEALKRLVPSDN